VLIAFDKKTAPEPTLTYLWNAAPEPGTIPEAAPGVR
jgi:hypothetical protein